VLCAAAVAGALSGPLALGTAAASQPPMTWGSLALAAGGTLLGLPAVLGLQAAQANLNALRWGWFFFLYASAYCTAAGVAAVAIAARSAESLAPSAWLFLVLGLAMLAGLAITRGVFKRKFGPR
jgi:hypothetical protein